jgi:hypothetical protein
MGANDNAGRIHKRAFLVSILSSNLHVDVKSADHSQVTILTVFAFCLVSVCARCYVRIRVQKQLSIDDGFLLFGVCCLISAIGVLFTFIDALYMIEALVFGIPNLELPPDWLQRIFHYQKMSAVGYILTWCTIVSVKFSFLFLFKTLITRIRWLVVYWWIVMVFTIAISGYGVAVYIIVCPYFGSMKSRKFCSEKVLVRRLISWPVQCGTGSAIYKVVNISISQMVLDIVSDLLSKWPSPAF